MADLDVSLVSKMSSEATIEQLTEEKVALQAQNAQLWRLVDKQRSMIVSLQKDLEKAKTAGRTDRARLSIGPEGSEQLPYPTTPKRGEHAERMPSAPDVIEDYDDVSSATEQSPEVFNSIPASVKSRSKRSSPRSLDYHHANRFMDGEPPVKSPLRSATGPRSQAVDATREIAIFPDGTTAPMSPALSLRMQQVTRSVSPLTQSFQNITITNSHGGSVLEEVERVNIPRRERVRSPTSRNSSSTAISALHEPRSRPDLQRHLTIPTENTPRPQTMDERSRPTLPQTASDTAITSQDSVVRPIDHEGNSAQAAADSPFFPPPLVKTMSKSESGGTLADITDPYYSDSVTYLPLTIASNSQQSLPATHQSSSSRPSRLAQAMSPESEYDEFDAAERSTEVPEASQATQTTLAPSVEFLPSPTKHVWQEHSPERMRSGSFTSMVSETSLHASETTPSVDTTASSIVPAKEVVNVKVHMVDCKSNSSLDIAVFRHDMIMVHKLRKTYADLQHLQEVAPLQSGLQFPPKEDFAPDRAGPQAARREAVDLWFQSLQEQISIEGNSNLATVFSTFLSTDILDNSREESILSAPLTKPSLLSEEHTATQQSARYEVPAILREGYLKKRGKNFGGWKLRYFVLDGPILRYFESPGGSPLGTIRLAMAQIGRQQSSESQQDKDVDNQQHAFLILEPKKRNTNSFVRHILCASSDVERDDWITALMTYVQVDERNEHTLQKNNKARSTGLTTPTRGTPYEANEPSPSNTLLDEKFTAIGYGETKPGRQPLFDPHNQILTSPANRSSVEPDSSGVVISRPMNGAPIENNTAWGATTFSSPSSNITSQQVAANTSGDKKSKKKSFWTFGKGHDQPNSRTDPAVLKSPSIHDLTFAPANNTPQTTGVFGIQLSDAVQMARDHGFNTGVPIVVSRCIDYLDIKHAEREEGIYRLSGSSNVIRGLKERFNQELDIDLIGGGEYFDIHAIAGLLKLYLRDLPASILTQDLQRDFLDILEIPEGLARTVTVRTLVHSLPKDNFELLKILSRHLSLIVSNADINKMSLRNVGIVFSPTLNIPAAVFSLFIDEYDALFEDRPAERARTLEPPVSSDIASIRSGKSSNPRASIILEAEQSYNLLQRNFSEDTQTTYHPYSLNDHDDPRTVADHSRYV